MSFVTNLFYLSSALSTTEPALYHALTSGLNESQQKQLNAVFVLADQRKAQQDSKRIEQSGGKVDMLVIVSKHFVSLSTSCENEN